LSDEQANKKVYPSMVDHKTATPGVYRRGNHFRVLTRPDGKRKVMHTFDTYEDAVAFKALVPKGSRRGGGLRRAEVAYLISDPCVYCGAASEVLDHIEPRVRGGSNHWSNLTGACAPCNGLKSDKPLLIFLAQLNGCWEWKQIRCLNPEK
jgi:5-methylcytosine-specific restriction endonuclease McrA